MKDEELADKYAEEWVKENMDCCKTDNSVNQPIPYFNEEERCCAKSACVDGFLVGLNAGRPQWHDLQKDKNDLPKDDKDMLMSEHLILLTKMKGTDNLSISLGQYNFSTQEFSYQHIVGLTDVIAWCEIPTFDKE